MIEHVTLKGEWHRKNTSASEVHEYRRAIRLSVLAMGGTFNASMPRGQSDELRQGTFQVTLPLSARFLDRPKAKRTGIAMLKAIVHSRTCRAPVMKVTSVEIESDWSQDGAGAILR